jgi:hypothetical protein
MAELVRKFEHKKNVSIGSKLLWFIVGLIPLVNIYWMWRVSRLIAEHEEKEYMEETTEKV